MKEVYKIIYRGNDTYTRVYRGSVLEYQKKIDYLSFTALEDSSIGTKITGTISPVPNVEYSRDKISWVDLTANTINLSAGETIYVRGNNPNSFSIDTNNYLKFVITGSVNGGGDLATLINKTGGVTEIPSAYYFRSLFNSAKGLKTAPYMNFTTLKTGCFRSMYEGSNIQIAPNLPATTLVNECYRNMFLSCSNLDTAPELPATILTNFCYANLFNGCSKLNYIKCLATDISATDCTTAWVKGVSATGTFVKSANMAGWTTGTSGIPTGWTVEDV